MQTDLSHHFRQSGLAGTVPGYVPSFNAGTPLWSADPIADPKVIETPMAGGERLYVTKPSLPPLEAFLPYLRQIWDSRVLTNMGPFHQQLEARLREKLGVSAISLFSNGMLALTTAIQALRISGEVITTPYSFVATSHALYWNGIKPVFVDVDPDTGNLDPARIEAAITPNTTAILATHVYGQPCDVDGIARIADRYGLKVIYDAAHAFMVTRNGRSILDYGDASALSFHATKVFNTFEGGALICRDDKTKHRIDYLKNFGFADETTVIAPGTNAKMNEFQAALGVLQLEYVDAAIAARGRIAARYRSELAGAKGIRIMPCDMSSTPNFSYFPIRVTARYGQSRDELYQKMRRENIYARRYFYPLISDFPTYRGLPSAQAENLPAARQLADEVLCLPIYPDFSESDQARVIRSLLRQA